MSYRTGPKIVTDGLALCLDAADRNSYAGSGNTWTDLSGNGNSGTLVNGPVFSSNNGGVITFDGSNDWSYFTASNAITGNNPSSLSMMGFFKSNPNNTARGYIFSLKKQSTPSTLFSIEINDNNAVTTTGYIGCLTWNGSAHTYLSYDGDVVDGNWHFVAAVVHSSGRELYLDGELVKTDTSVMSQNVSGHTSAYTVGAFDTGSNLYWGSIANNLVYTRRLSSDEITQNYNATKGRFGL
jgi:hypothetical protein